MTASLEFVATPLAGAYLVKSTPVKDPRGYFCRLFDAEEFARRGFDSRRLQCSASFNERLGTLRGLHYQCAPNEEHKTVRCAAGAIFDVIVDIRPQSPTYRRWFGAELSAANRSGLFIPAGFAHGFITLTDAAEVHYMISVPYAAESARGLRWNDPAFGIDWPLQPRVMSERDAAYPLLSSAGR